MLAVSIIYYYITNHDKIINVFIFNDFVSQLGISAGLPGLTTAVVGGRRCDLRGESERTSFLFLSLSFKAWND
jgi:hypothetical protein